MRMLPLGIWDYFLHLQQQAIRVRVLFVKIRKLSKQDVSDYFEYRHHIQTDTTRFKRIKETLSEERFELLDELFDLNSEYTKTRDYLVRLLEGLRIDYQELLDTQQYENESYDISRAIDTIPHRQMTAKDTDTLVRLAQSINVSQDQKIQKIQNDFIKIIQGEIVPLSFRMRAIMHFLIPCLIGFGIYKEFQKIHLKRVEFIQWYSKIVGRVSNRAKKQFDDICSVEKNVANLFLKVLQCPILVDH